MALEGLSPDVVTYNTVINACAQQKQCQRALEYFHRMVTDGLAPNLGTYNTLLNAYSRTNNIEGAMSVLSKMRGARLRPDTHTCSTFLTAARRARVSEEMQGKVMMCAEGLFRAVPIEDHDGFTYPPMIELLGKAKRQTEAMHLYRRAAASVAPWPNEYVVRSAKFACGQEMWEEIESLAAFCRKPERVHRRVRRGRAQEVLVQSLVAGSRQSVTQASQRAKKHDQRARKLLENNKSFNGFGERDVIRDWTTLRTAA